MTRQLTTNRLVRKLLAAALSILAALTVTGVAKPVEATGPMGCGTGNLQPAASTCSITPSPAVPSGSSQGTTGLLNLIVGREMTPVDFTTDVFVAPNYTILYDLDSSDYLQPDTSTTGNPLSAGLSAQIISSGTFKLRISGTPTAAGTKKFEIRMTSGPFDADYHEDASYTLTIAVTADNTAPLLQTAAVPSTGDRISLTYDETLTARSIDPTSYAVTVDGTPAVVSSAAASSSTVTLMLSSPVEAGATVQVSYVKPGSNPVEDAAGNDAANLTSRAVTNNSTRDLTPPTQRSATVDTTGLQLSVTYNESLTRVQANGRVRVMATPRASDFDVTVGGQSRTVSTVALSGSTVTLTLRSVVYSGETVKLSYTPSTGNEIEDAAGNAAAAFSQYEVTNNSTVAAPVQAAATPTTTAAQAAAPSPTATTTVAPTPEPRVVTASKKLPSTGSSVPVAPALIALSLAGMVILLVRRRVLTR